MHRVERPGQAVRAVQAVQEALDASPVIGLVAPKVRSKSSRNWRRAAAVYLRRSRARRIAEAYRKAYGRAGGLGDEWAGWENEGVWPAK